MIFIGCLDGSKIETARLQADRVMSDLLDDRVFDHFSPQYFPPDQIRYMIGEIRRECDYANRNGRYVDFFTEGGTAGPKVSFIYEYFMDCDSLRFMLRYDLAKKEPELIYFYMEPLEADNPMLIDKSKSILHR